MSQQFTTEEQSEAQSKAAIATLSNHQNVEVCSTLAEQDAANHSTATEEKVAASVSGHAAQVEQLLSEMREEVRLHNRRDTMFSTWFVVLFLTAILCPMCFSGSRFSSDPANMWLHYGPVALLLPTLILSLRMLMFDINVGKRTLRATHRIEVVDDLRFVGLLVELLEFGNPSVHRMAKAQLTRLLPQLKASDAALLNMVQRRKLNRFVGVDPYEPNFLIGLRSIRLWSRRKRQRNLDTDFQLAILSAYEQIGDASSLPIVYSIAYPTERILEKVEPEVVEAARHCLPFLEAVDEIDRASKQLLRASSASDVMPDTLLRPAAAQTTEEQSDSLLRATDSGTAHAAKERKVQP